MQDLDKFKNEMNLSGQNVYVGHRYVPKIMGDWDNTQLYEPLSIVQYQGNSFTSRQYVPSGVELTNEEYWASTGNYNAQIEQYRQDVRNLENDVNNFNDEVANVTTQLDETNKYIDEYSINVKKYGAKGDGVTDDTLAIQTAFDDLYDKGGGEIYFPHGDYIVTEPILVKAVATFGGYSAARILIKGQSNSGSTIRKVGDKTKYEYDAALLGIQGSTMGIDDDVSSVHFDNISVQNDSEAVKTYGYYMRRGSRIIVNYSKFTVKKDYATLATHDRYAFRVESIWSSTFSDSTFVGDYGLYIAGNSTSLLLENLFANTDKVGYWLSGAYSTINNCFGDYCRGTVFRFHYASYSATSLGAESPDCDKIIDTFNSKVVINNAYLYQSNLDEGSVIVLAGSDVKIDQLTVHMTTGESKGYLWNGGTKGTLTVGNLSFTGGNSKFKYNKIEDSTTKNLNVSIHQKSNKLGHGAKNLNDYSDGYYDWYMQEPEYPINDIVLGLNGPTLDSKDSNIRFLAGAKLNDIYFNNNLSKRNVAGWGRYAQNSTVYGEGSNYYIPFILSGSTSNRPTWQTVGMEYFDTTLGKPIWCKSASETSPVWVDATGTTV